MGTGRMIDAVAPTARGATLQADELRHKARIIE